jgi:hypothetical protein
LATLAVVADKSLMIKGLLAFYRPTGPVSGVTTVAVLVWFAAWVILERRWRARTVALERVGAAALVLLGLSLLLTFPPVADLL